MNKEDKLAFLERQQLYENLMRIINVVELENDEINPYLSLPPCEGEECEKDASFLVPSINTYYCGEHLLALLENIHELATQDTPL